VRVTFNPQEISFRDLLEVYFAIHDPTTFNRQGNDVGTQYRSVIFYNSEEQRQQAEQAIAELAAKKAFPDPIVTALEPATDFYIAEKYHQRYYDNNPNQPYCRLVVDPKVSKFEKKFAARTKQKA